MTDMNTPRLGQKRTINGRTLTLRSIYSRRLDWWDADAKEVVSTGYDVTADRVVVRRRRSECDDVCGAEIEPKVREQIRRLAKQNGMTLKETRDIVLGVA